MMFSDERKYIKWQMEEIFLFALIALLKFMDLKKLGMGGLSFFFF